MAHCLICIVWQPKVIAELENNLNIFAYDIDLSSCHIQVVGHNFSKKVAPLTHECIIKNDYWEDLASNVINNNSEFKIFPFKILRKLLKVASLAILNGGAIGKTKLFSHFLENGRDQEDIDLVTYTSLISNLLVSLPVSREFKEICNIMVDTKKCFLMTSPKQSVMENMHHKLASRIMCGGELPFMTYLLESLSYSKLQLLPLGKYTRWFNCFL
jgi:hypothetical protein